MFFFQGSMSRCPGYFFVTIYDLWELEELFKCDVLVSCPLQFSLAFHINSTSTRKLERTFEVVLDDLQGARRIFLTKLNLDIQSRRTFMDKTNDISTTSIDSPSSVQAVPGSSDGIVHYDYSRIIVIMSATAVGFVFYLPSFAHMCRIIL